MRGGPPTPAKPSPPHERSPSRQKQTLRKSHRAASKPTRDRSQVRSAQPECDVERPAYLDRNANGRAVHAITRGENSSPHPDEPRVVGAGRDRRSRRRSGRERSVPGPISRGRSGQPPAFEGTGARRAEQRGGRRALVPGAGNGRIDHSSPVTWSGCGHFSSNGALRLRQSLCPGADCAHRCDATACRTSHGWSGPDATDGAAGGAVASAAFRAPISRGRSRPQPAFGGTESRQAEQRRAGATLFPVPAKRRFRERWPASIAVGVTGTARRVRFLAQILVDRRWL